MTCHVSLKRAWKKLCSAERTLLLRFHRSLTPINNNLQLFGNKKGWMYFFQVSLELESGWKCFFARAAVPLSSVFH